MKSPAERISKVILQQLLGISNLFQPDTIHLPSGKTEEAADLIWNGDDRVLIAVLDTHSTSKSSVAKMNHNAQQISTLISVLIGQRNENDRPKWIPTDSGGFKEIVVICICNGLKIPCLRDFDHEQAVYQRPNFRHIESIRIYHVARETLIQCTMCRFGPVDLIRFLHDAAEASCGNRPYASPKNALSESMKRFELPLHTDHAELLAIEEKIMSVLIDQTRVEKSQLTKKQKVAAKIIKEMQPGNEQPRKALATLPLLHRLLICHLIQQIRKLGPTQHAFTGYQLGQIDVILIAGLINMAVPESTQRQISELVLRRCNEDRCVVALYMDRDEETVLVCQCGTRPPFSCVTIENRVHERVIVPLI